MSNPTTRIFTAIAAAALAFIPNAQAAVQTIEADNGAIYRLGAVHIPYDHKYPITAEVIDDNEQLSFFNFDCDGSFSIQTISGQTSGWRHIPSRSVVGRIAQLACAKRQ